MFVTLVVIYFMCVSYPARGEALTQEHGSQDRLFFFARYFDDRHIQRSTELFNLEKLNQDFNYCCRIASLNNS